MTKELITALITIIAGFSVIALGLCTIAVLAMRDFADWLRRPKPRLCKNCYQYKICKHANKDDANKCVSYYHKKVWRSK